MGYIVLLFAKGILISEDALVTGLGCEQWGMSEEGEPVYFAKWGDSSSFVWLLIEPEHFKCLFNFLLILLIICSFIS